MVYSLGRFGTLNGHILRGFVSVCLDLGSIRIRCEEKPPYHEAVSNG